MIRLNEIENSFAALAANRRIGEGNHQDFHPEIGTSGQIIGEVEFNPAVHKPSQIYPLSFGEQIDGVPRVLLVHPERPLTTNIVIHRNKPGTEDEQLETAKSVLMDGLSTALAEVAMDTGIGNHVNKYAVGSPNDMDRRDYDIELIHTTSPEKALEETRSISRTGITFVFSSVDELPITEYKSSNFADTIVIKTNHARDLRINPGKGVISLGGKREINRRNKRQVGEANQVLDSYHGNLIASMKNIGIVVAHAVFDGSGKYGFDTEATDLSIAKAIDEISVRS